MPVVFRYKGFRFFFYSNEGDPREPLHIHARKGEAVAKIRLDPRTELVESYGLTPAEQRELMRVADRRRDLIERLISDN